MARRGGWAESVSLQRRTRTGVAVAMAVALPAFSLMGCDAGRATPAVPAAHRLTVMAGLFPMAEVARRVGLDRVDVTDLTPTGADPRAVIAPAGELDGAVVLILGRGYQPGLEAAATSSSAKPKLVVAVGDAVGGNQAQVWLDPTVMKRVAAVVADALSRVDPAGQSAYRDGARAYSAQLGALDIDYRSSLTDCTRRDVVTADGAFAPMAARYGFTDHGAEEPGILALVQARRVPTIFTEPLVPDGPVLALARAAHAKVDSLTTLDTRSPEEATRGASYLSLMTDNLAKLRIAMACATGA